MTIPGPSGGGEPVGRTGVVLRDPLPWSHLAQVVETAEETGYESVFVPEIAGREAFGTLTGFAMSTDRVLLGTGVVTVGARSAVTTAMAAATVQDLSGNRLVLGIGSGQGMRVGGLGPLEIVERYAGAVRRILHGDRVPADDVLGTPAFQLQLPGPWRPPPLWLAALGDRMVELAGRIADGVLLNWCTPQRVADARGVIARSAESAGRDPSGVEVAVYVRACLGVDEEVALGALREMAGLYASFPSYRRQFEAMSLGDEASMAAKARGEGRPSEVPEPFVRALCALGGRAAALARFREYREAGADLVLCYPVAALDPLSSILGTVLGAAPSPSLER